MKFAVLHAASFDSPSSIPSIVSYNGLFKCCISHRRGEKLHRVDEQQIVSSGHPEYPKNAADHSDNLPRPVALHRAPGQAENPAEPGNDNILREVFSVGFGNAVHDFHGVVDFPSDEAPTRGFVDEGQDENQKEKGGNGRSDV
nr:hypothetical protein TorRG33x02_284700 [Ipomoea batatas]GMC76589.1 hypothetical protein TorRG33x02_284700 [Ipomoea batatas]